MAHPAMFYDKQDNGVVHCYLCAHHCVIAKGKFGFCGVRSNEEGELVTHSYGKVVALHSDPIEKKPLFHFLPGSRSLSLAAAGCNFRCGFCQNWQISQKKEADSLNIPSSDFAPAEIVRQAVDEGCRSIAYTYTEPTIFFEYAYDIARLARGAGLANIFVTNGYMTREALDAVEPYLDAANVDLKFFTDENYRKTCAGTLAPVLATIRAMHERKIWVEVTTLVIPGENDSDEELRGIARFLAQTGREIPWHLSLFHPDYRFMDRDYTPLDTLRRAYGIGKDAGLKYVYTGNVAEEENTYCASCNQLLLRRYGFDVLENNVVDNACPRCHTPLDGRVPGARRKAGAAGK